MTLIKLDHVNVRTSNLASMVAWYETVLGMVKGARPDFTIGGAWLYIGDDPVVHLVEVGQEPANDEPKIEHFAIQAHGYSEFAGKLRRHDCPYKLAAVPGFGIVQVNIHDPDGNHIHIDFDAAEVDPSELNDRGA